MKLQFSLFLIGLLSISILTDCKKDDNKTTNSGSMSAKIDGIEWKASSREAGPVFIGSTVGISGISSDGKSIFLSVNSKDTRSYLCDENSKNTCVYEASPSGSLFSTKDANDVIGTVVLTEYNETTAKASGTFEFSAAILGSSERVEITEGIFENISIMPSVETPFFGDKFSCTIDEQAYIPLLVWETGFPDDNNLNISISSTPGEPSLLLSLPKNINEDTFSLISNDAPRLTYSLDLVSYPCESGELIITHHDRIKQKIEGKFYGSAINKNTNEVKATIKDGVFSINY